MADLHCLVRGFRLAWISFNAVANERTYSWNSGSFKLLRETRFDLAAAIDDTAWRFVTVQFQKRHLLAHKLGVIDADYVSKTGCAASLLGRKVTITDGDVRTLVTHLKTLAEALYHGVPRI